MRPKNTTPMGLIYDYARKGKLHVMEVATLFGAFQAYERRGYTVNISINSFQSELLTEEENKVFNEAFPNSKGNGIIEILEYFDRPTEVWKKKREILLLHDVVVALDDYGTGSNDMKAVRTYSPNIVKRDRSVFADLDLDPAKQRKCRKIIERFHKMGIIVLGEGVETKEEMQHLVAYGIDLLQGFYLGIPE